MGRGRERGKDNGRKGETGGQTERGRRVRGRRSRGYKGSISP